MEKKEKAIIDFLKKNGRSSTTKIAFAIKSNVWRAKTYLDKLKLKKMVVCEEETNSTYWNLK